MHINFAMWRKASWELIKMDDKKEWDALDVISKWLIATRSAVTTVTIYSCIIAGAPCLARRIFCLASVDHRDPRLVHCAWHE